MDYQIPILTVVLQSDLLKSRVSFFYLEFNSSFNGERWIKAKITGGRETQVCKSKLSR